VKPRLLDLFSGAGGAARGYQLAGFHVTGVDINPQPRYAGDEFVQADAMRYPLDGFDAIHASPPCQAYSLITPDKDLHPRLIDPIRILLASTGLPYVIENVGGARRDLRQPLRLCGSSFGLSVRRHRYFESNVSLMSMPCAHGKARPIGVYGDHPENDHDYRRPDGTRRGAKALTVDHAREVMGMPWATWRECVEAIPPAYTRFIGEQLIEHVMAGAS
jgi:DNA (cytosine-5)-methyltransferase 1